MLWGVSGPIFLLDYLGAVAVAVAIAVAVRELTGRRARGATPDRVELAYLTDRALLACQLGVAALRRAGGVEIGELATLHAQGRPPAGSPALVRALHSALRRPQTWAAVLADPEVGRALRRTVGRLVRDGWLLTRAQRRRIALGTVPLFAVAVVGLTRLVDSAVEGRSAGGPASVAGLLLCCLATALGGWWLTEVPETGSAARRLLRRLRREHADLDPERRPVWQGRDTDTLLTGMALFGPRPLLAVDPAFAVQVGVDPERDRPRPDRKPARR